MWKTDTPQAEVKKTPKKSAKVLDAAKGPDAKKPTKTAMTPAPKPSKSIEADYASLKRRLKKAKESAAWWKSTIAHPEVQRLIRDLNFKIRAARLELEDCSPKDLAKTQATVRVLSEVLDSHLQGRAEGVQVRRIADQMKEMEDKYPIFVGPKKGAKKS